MHIEDFKVVVKEHVKYVKGQVGGKRADVRYADLSGLNLDKLPLRDAILTACDFTGTSMVGTDLSAADLQNCNFADADLSDAVLDSCDLRGANMQSVRARSASLHAADLRPARLVRKPSADADIKDDTIVTTTANLRQVDLNNADLSYAKLKHADLGHANMEGADMTGADLESSNLERANLRGAIINSTNFRFAETETAEIPTPLSDIESDLRVQLLDHYAYINSDGTKGTLASLDGNAYDEIVLSGLNLSAVGFKGAKLRRADLSRAIGIFTNFEKADLSGARLHGADFDATSFRVANLSGADLSHGKYRPVKTKAGSGAGARDRSWPVDFTNADLSHANLEGSLFNDVDFRGATLDGMSFFGATFMNCYFDNGVSAWMREQSNQPDGISTREAPDEPTALAGD